MTDLRQLTVGPDPVAHPELAHDTERVARAGTVALGRERVATGLHRPPSGVQRGERQRLLLGRQIERVRYRTAEQLGVRDGPPRLARFARLPRLAYPARDLRAEIVGKPAQPAARVVHPVAGERRIHAEGLGDLVAVEVVDRAFELAP